MNLPGVWGPSQPATHSSSAFSAKAMARWLLAASRASSVPGARALLVVLACAGGGASAPLEDTLLSLERGGQGGGGGEEQP